MTGKEDDRLEATQGKDCLMSRKLALNEGESEDQEGKEISKGISIYYCERLRYMGKTPKENWKEQCPIRGT